MKNTKLLGLVLVMGLSVASSALAAEFVYPGQGNSVTIPGTQTHKNLFTAAQNVIIESRVMDDLYAAGGSVQVIGGVNHNAHLVGGNISVSGPVGSDLYAAGGNVFLSSSASVNGDLLAAGGNVDIEGVVAGNVRVAANTVTINNVVAGNIYVKAQRKLTFGSNAKVGGKIVYYGNPAPVILAGAKIPNIVQNKMAVFNKSPLSHRSLFGFGLLISLLAWLVAGFLLWHFAKVQVGNGVALMQKKFWSSFGIGLAAFVVFPITIILLFVVLVGYLAALIILAWYLFALLLAGLLSAIFLGTYIYTWFDKTTAVRWQTVLLGIVAYRIITWIPILGWLVCAVLGLAALGAILQMARQQIRKP